jgi:hypothetical protein
MQCEGCDKGKRQGHAACHRQARKLGHSPTAEITLEREQHERNGDEE